MSQQGRPKTHCLSKLKERAIEFMKQIFDTTKSIEAFAAAFSRASAKGSMKPQISLDDTLHCIAVASDYENWATMKSRMASKNAIGTPNAKSEIQMAEPNEYFELNLKHHFHANGGVPHNLVVLSEKSNDTGLPNYKIAVNEAIAAGHHVIILGHSEKDLEIFGVDVMHSAGIMEATDTIRAINKSKSGKKRLLAPFLFLPKNEAGEFDVTPSKALRMIVTQLAMVTGRPISTLIVIPDIDNLIAMDDVANNHWPGGIGQELPSFLLACRRMSMSFLGGATYQVHKALLNAIQAHSLCVHKRTKNPS